MFGPEVSCIVKHLVIADDLTGAFDTAIQYTKKNIEVSVSIYPDIDKFCAQDSTEVLVADTESRHISPSEAAERVKRVVRKGLRAGVGSIYKKTDSVLRGNIGSELAAVMEVSKKNSMAFIPAYPAANRTTQRGVHFVNGVPLHRTGLANDPINPIKTSNVAEIIGQSAGLEVRVVPAEYKGDLTGKGNGVVYVFDACSDEDMMRIAQHLYKRKALGISAGCAGFSGILADVLEFEKNKNQTEKLVKGNMLIVCGSVNEVSINQVSFAQKCGFTAVTLSAEQKTDETYYESESGRRFIDGLAAALESNGRLIVCTTDPLRGKESFLVNDEQNEMPFRISNTVSVLVKQVMKRTRVGTLMIFGGETAVKVLRRLECTVLKIVDEVGLGTVLSVMDCKQGKCNLITKSGGFGKRSVIVDVNDYIERHIEPREDT